MNQSGPVRKLSTSERMRWGECPVCHAPHGEYCSAAVGIHLGKRVDGKPMFDGDGVHLARIKEAPYLVREVPA